MINNLNIGDFIKILTENHNFIMKINNINNSDCYISGTIMHLFSNLPNCFNLYQTPLLIHFFNINRTIKEKITDEVLIKKLELKYKIYLLQQS